MSNQYDLPEPPKDIISAVRFAPHSSNRLLVSSWDKRVYLYETPSPLESHEGYPIAIIEHRAPVLDVCFGEDDDTAYSACLDCDVVQLDLQNPSQKTVLSTHSQPVRNVRYSSLHKMLISSGWDNTIHIHLFQDGTLSHTPSIVTLSATPHCLALSDDKLIVGLSDRSIVIYELEQLRTITSQSSTSPENPENRITVKPFQTRESALKYMLRDVTCTPNGEGYAISSIEGRVAVEFFDEAAEIQAKRYAFKCHRTTTEEEDIVYPVNVVAYHPTKTTTFLTGGGDGAVVLWDGVNKRRIRQYSGFASSIAGTAWSPDGKLLAVGVSPPFVDGQEEVDQNLIKISIRAIPESDLKGKGAR